MSTSSDIRRNVYSGDSDSSFTRYPATRPSRPIYSIKHKALVMLPHPSRTHDSTASATNDLNMQARSVSMDGSARGHGQGPVTKFRTLPLIPHSFNVSSSSESGDHDHYNDIEDDINLEQQENDNEKRSTASFSDLAEIAAAAVRANCSHHQSLPTTPLQPRAIRVATYSSIDRKIDSPTSTPTSPTTPHDNNLCTTKKLSNNNVSSNTDSNNLKSNRYSASHFSSRPTSPSLSLTPTAAANLSTSKQYGSKFQVRLSLSPDFDSTNRLDDKTDTGSNHSNCNSNNNSRNSFSRRKTAFVNSPTCLSPRSTRNSRSSIVIEQQQSQQQNNLRPRHSSDRLRNIQRKFSVQHTTSSDNFSPRKTSDNVSIWLSSPTSERAREKGQINAALSEDDKMYNSQSLSMTKSKSNDDESNAMTKSKSNDDESNSNENDNEKEKQLNDTLTTSPLTPVASSSAASSSRMSTSTPSRISSGGNGRRWNLKSPRRLASSSRQQRKNSKNANTSASLSSTYQQVSSHDTTTTDANNHGTNSAIGNGARQNMWQKVTATMIATSKTRKAGIFNVYASSMSTFSVLHDTFKRDYSGVVTSRKQNELRMLVQMSKSGKVVPVCVCCVVEDRDRDGYSRLWIRRVAGESNVKVTNEEFDWFCSEFHDRLQKVVEVSRPFYS